MSRVHIPIGRFLQRNILAILIGLAIVTMSVGISCEDLQADTRLVVAQTHDGHWQTNLLATNMSSTPATITLCDLTIFGCHVELQTGSSLNVDNLAAYRTDGAEFWLMPAPDAEAFTFVRFNDGVNCASFQIPPVGAIEPNTTQHFGPVINLADFKTTVTVFAAKWTRVLITITGPNGTKLGTESFDANAGVNQYVLATPFAAGVIVIEPIDIQVNGGEASPIYGFVDVGNVTSGARYVLPFRP